MLDKKEAREEGLAEGRAEGRVQGRAEGRQEGEKRFARLCDMLLDQNRLDDMKRAVKDEAYRGQLFEEYGL